LRILLTGSNGFLGKVIYENLSTSHDVYTLNKRNSNYNVNLALDKCDFNQNFEVVIHSAGKAHALPVNEIERNNFFNTNVTGTKNLLKGLEDSPPKKFIYISSVSVYGLIIGDIISETTPLLAQDPYGKSKIEAEDIVKKWCAEHGVICTILRLPLIVGKNAPGNLGAMIRGIKKGYYFNIAGGYAKKSMVLATDVAKFILAAAQKGGTYNLTDGCHPTFNELSKSIANQIGKSFVPTLPIFTAQILAKFGDFFGDKFPINSVKLSKITSTLTFDDTKARLAFAWNPSPVLECFKIQ
jgi:nucleoside-diphosphate-sugar epimerase